MPNEAGQIYQILRHLCSIPESRIAPVQFPCPGDTDAESHSFATSLRFRIYNAAKKLRSSDDQVDRTLGYSFIDRWKLQLVQADSGTWAVQASPRSADPMTAILAQATDAASAAATGRDPALERDSFMEELKEIQAKVSSDQVSGGSGGESNSDTFFRNLYGGKEASASKEAPAPTPDPTTLSDAELRAEIEAYIATDSAIPPELDAESKRRGTSH